MKRKALSGRLLAEKLVFFVLLVIVLIFSVRHYPQILYIAGPVLITLDYLIYYRPDHVEFDNESLFVKRKRREEIIPLRDIYQIKMTGWGIGYKTIWKIRYVNNNREGVARFYPRFNSSGLAEFINLVKTRNPGLQVKNY